MLQDMLAHEKVSKRRKNCTNTQNLASSSHTLVYEKKKKKLVTHRQSYRCNSCKRVFKCFGSLFKALI